jgi:hypothetical protein
MESDERLQPFAESGRGEVMRWISGEFPEKLCQSRYDRALAPSTHCRQAERQLTGDMRRQSRPGCCQAVACMKDGFVPDNAAEYIPSCVAPEWRILRDRVCKRTLSGRIATPTTTFPWQFLPNRVEIVPLMVLIKRSMIKPLVQLRKNAVKMENDDCG